MAEKPYRIGIDLGGTNIKTGVIDRNNRIVGSNSVKTRPQRPYQEVMADMAGAVNALLENLNIPLEQCEKIGIGSPGMVDSATGVVVFAGNLSWNDVPLVQELETYFSLPIRLSNDANCAALGETLAGAGRGCGNILLLTLGTGLGGGVVVNHRLQEGAFPGGMELGHVLLVMDGEPCSCGRRGCVEAYCSAAALARFAVRAAKANPESLLNSMCGGELSRMNGVIPFKAARQNDAAATQVVEDYIRFLGECIINFVNLWRPEKVLLGGGVSGEGDPLVQPLNAYIKTRCFGGQAAFVPPVAAAELGNSAGLIGAASL